MRGCVPIAAVGRFLLILWDIQRLTAVDILTPLKCNKPNDVRKEDGRMFHKGLNREALIDAAKRLIEESGVSAFSMRTLADKLGMKAASLYAHIESMDALFTQVGLSALNDQKAVQLSAVQGKSRDQAVMQVLADYRISEEHRMHWQRVLRGVMHGFASQEAAGYLEYPARSAVYLCVQAEHCGRGDCDDALQPDRHGLFPAVPLSHPQDDCDYA